MNKIIWIASYPKSGNTFVRLVLGSYFYTPDGITKNFDAIKNIITINNYNLYKNLKNFPSKNNFNKVPQSISAFWQDAQKMLSEKIKKNLFIKTHNCMAEILNKKFTNEKYTKCFIYIVRDPRSVSISYKHHFNTSYENAVKQIMNVNLIDNDPINNIKVPELISSWSVHYNSWKDFVNKGNGIIIKYEDLKDKTEETFYKIFEFLGNFINFKLDKEKLTRTINSNTFNNLQKIEKEEGFDEKPKVAEKFFRKGINNEWQLILTSDQQKMIETKFQNEMIELGYL